MLSRFNINGPFTFTESRIMQIISAGFDLMESTIIWERDMAECALRQSEVVATNHNLTGFTFGYLQYTFNEFMRLAEEVSATDSNQREMLIKKVEIIADFLGWDISEQARKIRKIKPSEFQQLVQQFESAD